MITGLERRQAFVKVLSLEQAVIKSKLANFRSPQDDVRDSLEWHFRR
jgi:hypothetical protein